MPDYIDSKEVQHVVSAIERLGVQDYALTIEPVRGWYYLLLCNTAQSEGDRRPKGTRMARSWVVEEEYGPLRGSDTRKLVNEMFARKREHDMGDEDMKPMTVFVIKGDPALKVRGRSMPVSVRRGNKVEGWQVFIAHIAQWPDLEDLAEHGEYKAGADRPTRSLEELFYGD